MSPLIFEYHREGKLHMMAREGVIMPYHIPFILKENNQVKTRVEWIAELRATNVSAVPDIDDNFPIPPLKFFRKRIEQKNESK